MSTKLELGNTAKRDPFAQQNQGGDRSGRKKKGSDDDQQENLAALQQAHEASPAASKPSAEATAALMSHWSDQKAPAAPPIDTLTTADRMRMMDRRKPMSDARRQDKQPDNKAAEASKSQSQE